MYGRKKHQDLLIRVQKMSAVEEVGVVLAEIQRFFGFLFYYVLDTSRLTEKEPISCLFPSNIPASVFCQSGESLANRMSVFMQERGTFGPARCDLAEAEAMGRMTSEVAAVFRASRMLRGVTFPALGISGAPRLIGFSGDRRHLEIEEIEELNVLMFHAHARLSAIAHTQPINREPLSGLERQLLSLASEGESHETISVDMALSSRTISYLVDSICRKMEVETIEHAVAVTLRRRMVG